MKLLQLVASFAVLACAQSPAADAKHGKELFLSYACYSCHSFDGHGGAGARLVPMPLNQAGFIAIRPQRRAHAVRTAAKVISDAQLTDIYAYIKTLPTSPDAKNIRVGFKSCSKRIKPQINTDKRRSVLICVNLWPNSPRNSPWPSGIRIIFRYPNTNATFPRAYIRVLCFLARTRRRFRTDTVGRRHCQQHKNLAD